MSIKLSMVPIHECKGRGLWEDGTSGVPSLPMSLMGSILRVWCIYMQCIFFFFLRVGMGKGVQEDGEYTHLSSIISKDRDIEEDVKHSIRAAWF